jgi:hypothetical protein
MQTTENSQLSFDLDRLENFVMNAFLLNFIKGYFIYEKIPIRKWLFTYFVLVVNDLKYSQLRC